MLSGKRLVTKRYYVKYFIIKVPSRYLNYFNNLILKFSTIYACKFKGICTLSQKIPSFRQSENIIVLFIGFG